jgi:hypothetical protein
MILFTILIFFRWHGNCPKFRLKGVGSLFLGQGEEACHILTRKAGWVVSLFAVGLIALSGCTSMDQAGQLEREIALKEQEIASLQSSKADLERELAARETEAEKQARLAWRSSTENSRSAGKGPGRGGACSRASRLARRCK